MGRFLASLPLLLLALACQGAPTQPAESSEQALSDPSQTTVPAPPSRPTSMRLEDPLAGCRGPDEPGCQRCCTYSDAKRCSYRTGAVAAAGNGSPPWYDEAGNDEGPCPGECKPCARCTHRDAWSHGQLQRPEGCDCGRAGVGPDACQDPRSCDCYCQRLRTLLSLCPQLE